MKEILITFGSIVAILLCALLLYENVYWGNTSEIGYLVGDAFGIIFPAAGSTRLWVKGRFKLDYWVWELNHRALTGKWMCR